MLLVQRGRSPFRGLWSLPGGNIEAHENPRDTALRELKEEAEIEAEIAGLLDSIEIAAEDDSGKALRYRLSVFYGRYVRGIICAGGDAAVAQWVALDDIESLPLTGGTAALIGLAAQRLGLTLA